MALSGSSRSTFASRAQTLLAVLMISMMVLIVLNQANPMTTRLGRDSGVFAYVASHLLRGNMPYVAAWENKPPGIFFVDAAAIWLGRGTRWGIWAAEWLFLTGAALVGFAALKRVFGMIPAVLSTLIWLVALSFVLEGGNFTEEYSLLFSFIALLLFTLLIEDTGSPWVHLGLGIVFGCSFLLRPNNAGVPAVIFFTEIVLVVLKQRPASSLKNLILSAAGFLLAVVPVALYFELHGALGALLEWGFVYGPSFGGHLDLPGAVLGGFRHLGLSSGVALVGLWVAFELLAKQIVARRINPLILWLCIDSVIEVVLSGLSGQNYPHYFICWLPWIAIASALLVRELSAVSGGVPNDRAVPLLIAGLLVLGLLSWGVLEEYGRSIGRLLLSRSAVQWSEPVAQYVNEHTVPGETVLAWGGESGLNFLSQRDAPTAQVTYNMLVPSPITNRLARDFYDDIRSHPPVLIVDGSGGRSSDLIAPLSTINVVEWSASHGVYAPPYVQEFFDLVHRSYSLKATVTGVPIYRLNP